MSSLRASGPVARFGSADNEAPLVQGAAPAAVGAWVDMLAQAFNRAGIDGARRDARLLVAHAALLDQTQMILCSAEILTVATGDRIEQMAARRLAGEPVSRIIGHRAFWGLQFEIGPAVLDPRPDTETLVEAVLALLRDHDHGHDHGCAAGCGPAERIENRRILDLGTGSGAILLAVLNEVENASGLGVDLSNAALGLARANASRLGLEARSAFIQADWWNAVEPRDRHQLMTAPFDIIVSNPPYIPSKDIAGLAIEVRCHDPISALDGGSDGLDAYRIIAAGARDHLRAGGWLVLEVGAGQAGEVQELLQQHGFDAGAAATRGETGLRHDLAGIARCIVARAPMGV